MCSMRYLIWQFCFPLCVENTELSDDGDAHWKMVQTQCTVCTLLDEVEHIHKVTIFCSLYLQALFWPHVYVSQMFVFCYFSLFKDVCNCDLHSFEWIGDTECWIGEEVEGSSCREELRKDMKSLSQDSWCLAEIWNDHLYIEYKSQALVLEPTYSV